jgi:hypothetical protein
MTEADLPPGTGAQPVSATPAPAPAPAAPAADPADPISRRDALRTDQNFMAKLLSGNPFVRDPAMRLWDQVNAEAAQAETTAARAADERDGSPAGQELSGPEAYNLPPTALLANQEVDPETEAFGRQVSHALGLSQNEFEMVAVAWSGAVASADRGDAMPDAETGIRELARRHGIEEADKILADARAFVAAVPAAMAERVREMLSSSGLANNVAFVTRLADMHRDRQAQRK